MIDDNYEIRFDPEWEKIWMGPVRLGPLLFRWLCVWAGIDGVVRITGKTTNEEKAELLPDTINEVTYPKFD